MSGLLRSIATRVPALRGPAVTQRANIFTRPAKDRIGAPQTVFGLGMFTVAILGPAAWVLAHLEEYKKKE